MIHEGLLSVVEADRMKQEWTSRHRYRLKFDSFRDLIR